VPSYLRRVRVAILVRTPSSLKSSEYDETPSPSFVPIPASGLEHKASADTRKHQSASGRISACQAAVLRCSRVCPNLSLFSRACGCAKPGSCGRAALRLGRAGCDPSRQWPIRTPRCWHGDLPSTASPPPAAPNLAIPVFLAELNALVFSSMPSYNLGVLPRPA
jgi:hypothetical protein